MSDETPLLVMHLPSTLLEAQVLLRRYASFVPLALQSILREILHIKWALFSINLDQQSEKNPEG